MGHDISAYIRTKSEEPKEVSYLRISAFNKLRRTLFYNTLVGASAADGGVSGNGSTLEFNRETIENAMNLCMYFLTDDSLLKEKVNEYMEVNDSASKNADETLEFFKSIFSSFDTHYDDGSHGEMKEHIADISKFHHNILWEYDNLVTDENEAKIEIYFG